MSYSQAGHKCHLKMLAAYLQIAECVGCRMLLLRAHGDLLKKMLSSQAWLGLGGCSSVSSVYCGQDALLSQALLESTEVLAGGDHWGWAARRAINPSEYACNAAGLAYSGTQVMCPQVPFVAVDWPMCCHVLHMQFLKAKLQLGYLARLLNHSTRAEISCHWQV